MAAHLDTATQTLSMLEERLQRIEFVVNGETDDQGHAGTESSASASARLKTLERNLNALASRSFTVSDILAIQNQHPHLFHPADLRSTPSTMPPTALAQLLLAHEKLYTVSASQLSSLNENNEVPDSTPLSRLLSMEAHIQELQVKQQEQIKEVAELRMRSARVVERWYEDGVLDMGARWAEWEERLRDCEILVRRKEAARKREDEAV